MHKVANIDDYLAAWQQGLICLHPTDTIPGISFRPDQAQAWQNLQAIKGRSADQTCIAMTATLEMALNFWSRLPQGWEATLSKLWPGPLSVVWQAGEACPQNLVRADGSIALRVPSWSQKKAWMFELLQKLEQPFPSTSVNRAGEAAAISWNDALLWLEKYGKKVVVPGWYSSSRHENEILQPSTLIIIKAAIDQKDCYQILRAGRLKQEEIERALNHARNIGDR